MSHHPPPLGATAPELASSDNTDEPLRTPISYISISKLSIHLGELGKLSEGLVRLLKSVDSCGYNLYDGPALQRAIWRYETMWLPLLAALKYKGSGLDAKSGLPAATQIRAIVQRLYPSDGNNIPDEEIVPPLDVAWVWYVHRLAVEVYLADVEAIVGIPVAPDASVGFRYGTSNRSGKSRLWRKAYPGKIEGTQEDNDAVNEENGISYFPSYLQSLVNRQGSVAKRAVRVGSISPVSYESHISYNISEAVKVHRGILWLYMRNNDVSMNYIPRAVARYESYMLMLALNPEKELEAADDIDFAWRVHCASTKEYIEDDLVYCAMSRPNRTTSYEGGSSSMLFAHNDARIVHLQKSPFAKDTEKMLLQSAKVWESSFGDMLGPYIIPEHAPRLEPRGKRDGYLQEVLRRKFAGGIEDSDSDSDSESESAGSESEASTKNEHSTFREHRIASSNLDDIRTPCESETHCAVHAAVSPAPVSDNLLPHAGNSVVRSPISRPKRAIVSISSIRSKKFLFEPGIEKKSAHLSVRTNTHLSKIRSTSSTSRESSDTEVECLERRKLEQRLRRDEEEEIQRGFVRQGHGLSNASGRPTFSRSQLISGCVMALIALGLVAAGIRLMSQQGQAFETVGVSLFMVGLLCLLLATLALKCPDSEERDALKTKSDAQRQRRRDDALARRKAKERKRKEVNEIHFYDFCANETGITVGGGQQLTSFMPTAPVGGDSAV